MQEVRSIERAVLVSLATNDPEADEALLDELKELVSTAGAEVVAEVSQRRPKQDPTHYIGMGKAEELYAEIQELDADLVVVNDDLNPIQQRNLEEAVGVRVIDRTQLILDIFAQRAHTREGKLQVELAQLRYLLPRLRGAGLSMSRLGGGIGTRGPGETKLESDRRRIRERITDLSEELEDVRKHRRVQKQARERLPYPTATLVGYTSAGKSTLLNQLSGADVLVDRKLFATLDPTTRRIELPDGSGILLTDTVGFIRNLPHQLVAAFRATLEEVTDADFLIHVVDANHPQMEEQMEAVRLVLEELGAGEKPTLVVYNKSDLVADQYSLRARIANHPGSVYMSAATGEGVPQLMSALTRMTQELLVHISIDIPYSRNDLVSVCYDSGRVQQVEYTPDSIHIEADVARDVAGRLTQAARPSAGVQ